MSNQQVRILTRLVRALVTRRRWEAMRKAAVYRPNVGTWDYQPRANRAGTAWPS